MNPFIVASLAFVSAATLQAGTLYWDGGDTTADADGGAGAWDTTSTNWDNAATAGANIAWPSIATGDDDAVFGTAGGEVIIDAAGIKANDITFAVAGYTVSGGPLTLDASLATPTITSDVAATISANLLGSGGLTKTGNGTLTLSGDNTNLSGPLVISGATSGNNGAVRVNSSEAFGDISSVGIQVNSSLHLGGATLPADSTISVSGGGGTQTPEGAIHGIAGTNVINSPVKLLDGAVRLGNIGSSSSITFNGAVTAAEASGFGLLIRYANTQGVILTNTANYWEGQTQLHSGSAYFHPGALPVTSNVTLANSGSAWLETNGTFTRTIGSGAGQIQINNTNAGRVNGLGARGGDLEVNFGGVAAAIIWGVTPSFNPIIFGLGSGNSDGTVTLLNPIDLNGANRTINSTNGSAEIDGEITSVIGGAAGSILTKTGTGVLLLSNANTHPGGTVIAGSQGAANPLRISNAGALGSGSLTIGGGGNNDQSRLELTGGITIANAIPALTSRNNDFPNIVNVSGNNTISSNISGGGGGSRTNIESAADKLVLGGTVSVRQLNLFGEGEGEISGNVTIASGGTPIYILNKAGGGKWTIGGDMSNSNGVTIAGGTLQIGKGGATGSLGVAPVINNGALIFDRTGAVTIPGAISGSGTITKRGTSAITLSGATIEHTGDTAIEDGTLLVTGDATNATGAVTVGDGIGDANSAILGGTGPIGGAVALDNDGAIAPGTSAGTLTASAGVSGDGSLLVEVDGATADQLIVGGTLDISAMKLDLTAINAPTENVYVIVNAASAITGAEFAAVTGSIPGYTVTYNYNDGVDAHNIALVGAPVSDPFENWATTTHGLAGAAASADADPDNDGLDNSVEFVLGGQPNPANPGASSSALAPAVTLDATNLVITYRRSDLSMTQPGIQIGVEYGSNLTGWTPAVASPGGVTINVTENVFGAGVDKVEVLIPRALAVGSKLFARLNVVIP